MPHPALSPDNVAVVTGGASGIGLAAARRFAALGMNVCIADLAGDRLEARGRRARRAAAAAPTCMAVPTDVSASTRCAGWKARVRERFGRVARADEQCRHPARQRACSARRRTGSGCSPSISGASINGTQVFAPGMIAHGEPGLIINTGSKQGITTPPGDPPTTSQKPA